MIFASSDRTVDISSYLAGDITGDGKLNTRDIVRGMKYIAGSFGTGEIHNEQLTAFDSNFDTVIDVKDLVRAMKLIAGADVDLSLEWYGGRQLSYKHNYYYSALTREMGNVSQFYISTINTLEEFNEYISAAQRVFDYEADLTFVDERDRGRYENRTVDAEALKARYNEAFFSNHTLIAASIYSIDESTEPILLDVMENGYNIPCVEFSYRLFNYDEDYGLFGAVDCFVHNFIELDKINYVPEYEDGEIIVGRYVIRGLQEYNRVTG